jgi:hypothetical protein
MFNAPKGLLLVCILLYNSIDRYVLYTALTIITDIAAITIMLLVGNFQKKLHNNNL